METLADELTKVLNRASAENKSNTPDWILANYLIACLEAFDAAVNTRETWYGRENLGPGQSPMAEAGERGGEVKATKELIGWNTTDIILSLDDGTGETISFNMTVEQAAELSDDLKRIVIERQRQADGISAEAE